MQKLQIQNHEAKEAPCKNGGYLIEESLYDDADADGCFVVQRDSSRAAFVPDFFDADQYGHIWEEDHRRKWREWAFCSDESWICLVARDSIRRMVVGYAILGQSREAVFPKAGEVRSFYALEWLPN